MNKEQLSRAIGNRIESLDVLIERIRKESAFHEPGHIVVSPSKGIVRFYKVQDSADKKGKRIYLKDEKEIKKLCNQLYTDKLLDAAIRERAQLNKCLVHFNESGPVSDTERVFCSLNESIQRFVVPDSMTNDGYAKKWQAQKVACAPKTYAHIYQTIRGDLVRSKSEALIADRLYTSDIPYRYEQVLVIDERLAFNIFPDFRILNKRTRKEIIWEHCGMMDDPKYCKDSLERIDLLGEKGFIQGKNLIFTYECSSKPLNLDYVNKLIKQFLV